jgi:hypothetical protein
MTITEYLASADYYLDPELDEAGDIKATKGAIIVRNDQRTEYWRVYQLVENDLILSKAEFVNPNPAAFIAFLRALEQA